MINISIFPSIIEGWRLEEEEGEGGNCCRSVTGKLTILILSVYADTFHGE